MDPLPHQCEYDPTSDSDPNDPLYSCCPGECVLDESGAANDLLNINLTFLFI